MTVPILTQTTLTQTIHIQIIRIRHLSRSLTRRGGTNVMIINHIKTESVHTPRIVQAGRLIRDVRVLVPAVAMKREIIPIQRRVQILPPKQQLPLQLRALWKHRH